MGLTESPGAFVRGVGKGSVSLLKGMALSTASILGSATDSVSTVTQSVATGTCGSSGSWLYYRSSISSRSSSGKSCSRSSR